MRVIYPYNEILPNRKAHDAYLYQSCVHLANAGIDVTLLCGKGSFCKTRLDQHYYTKSSSHLHIHPLPIIRKNNVLNLSYNRLFFYLCQKEIKKIKPDILILSVLKQGIYHLERKCPTITYIYEIHELSYYPGDKITPKFLAEKRMLAKADLLLVTTESLKKILQEPPYQLHTPIIVIPLATYVMPLPPPTDKKQLHLFYIGSLYQGQGIDVLLHALAKTVDVQLTLIGGNEEEVFYYSKMSQNLGIKDRTLFLGFQPPSRLQELVKEADGFVAPFTSEGRMPYVAHTKLHDYIAWQRPIIAPDLPIVREHCEKCALLFEPGNSKSLAEQIRKLQNEEVRKAYYAETCIKEGEFSWGKRIELYKQALGLANSKKDVIG